MADVMRDIEVSTSRSINKAVPEGLVGILILAAAAAVEVIGRALTDDVVFADMPPGVIAAGSLAVQIVVQGLRRMARDRFKVDRQV